MLWVYCPNRKNVPIKKNQCQTDFGVMSSQSKTKHTKSNLGFTI